MHRCLRFSAKSRNGALLLLAPLALQLVLFKLIKFAILSGAAETARAVPQDNLVRHLLVEHASVPALVLAVSLFLLVVIVTQFSLSGPGATALALSLWAVISATATRLIPGSQLWLDERFYTAVRWDLFIVLALALCVLVSLEHLRGLLRKLSITAIHLLVLALMLLASLDFGYFVLTGSLADSFMLRYAFANTGNLSYVLLHELSGTKVVLLIVPLTTVAISYAYCIGPRRPSQASRLPTAILAMGALCLVLVRGKEAADHSAVLSRATFSELITRVTDHGAGAKSGALSLAEAGKPFFRTDNMRLVPDSAHRPNIVLVILESQRHPDHLKPGLLVNPTPFLDDLMRRSVVVDEMYAVVPHTNKALVPILCGVHPRISQGDETTVAGRCLPELLTDVGYRSAFFTPATLAFERKADLLANMGFHDMFGDGHYDVTGFERVNYFGHEERIMLQPSMRWIDNQVAGSRSFMATFLTTTPHHPYKTASHFPVRSFGDERPDFNSYLNALAYVDDFLRRLIDEFDSRGLLESTMFIIVGDHGEAFGEHGLRFHSAVPYDEVLKVPALIFAPGFISPSTIRGPRQQTDLLPTVVELLGGRLEDADLPGISLTDSIPDARTLYHAGWIENQSMSIRHGDRKYVYHFGRRPTEVFDLAADPMELDPDELPPGSRESKEIAATLHLWRARVNASY